RTDLLVQRQRLLRVGSPSALAEVNASLAAEAFSRAERLTRDWLDRRDARTGLFPKSLRPDGQIWNYGDAAADFFPFLGISTRFLVPERFSEILATLAAERAYSPGFPENIELETGPRVPEAPEKQ